MRNGATVLGTPFKTSPFVIGSGGYMTGLDMSSDGTIIGRLDSAPPVLLQGGTSLWVKQFQPDVDIQVSSLDTNLPANTYGAAIAWSNSAVRYVAAMGFVWVKKPGATYYTRTTLARRLNHDANGTNRGSGNALVVDPANPGVCWFADYDGIAYTTDYGDNWTIVSTAVLPLPTSGLRHIMRFDRSSAVTSGRTQRLYIYVPRNDVSGGWYRSNDAGANWTQLPAMPTSWEAGAAKIHPTTGLLITAGSCSGGDGPVRLWNGTVWSTATSGGSAFNTKTIAFNPYVANRVVSIASGGRYRSSDDNGATFSSEGTDPVPQIVDIPWQSTDGYKTVGEIEFSPIANELYISAGVGCWKMIAPTTGTPQYVGISKGIENMIGTCVQYHKDGAVGISMQDKCSMSFPRREIGRKFPVDYGPHRGEIVYGNVTQPAPEDDKFWVTTCIGAPLGYTTDNWKPGTITEVDTLLAISGNNNRGGQIAVLSKDVWLVAQLAGGALNATNRAHNAMYLTRNRGQTWTEVPIGNGNATMAMSSAFSFNPRKTLTVDPFVPGRAWFYNPSDVENPNSADSLACRGTYRIDVDMVGSGFTVTRTNSNRLHTGNQDYINNKLNVIGPNDLVFLGGYAAPTNFRSTDGGVTWNEMIGSTDSLGAGDRFCEINGFARGKKHPDSSFDTLYAIGFRGFTNYANNGTTHYLQHGLWRSHDNGATWDHLDYFPGGVLSLANDLDASMLDYGEVVLTYGNMGAVALYYDDKIRIT